MNENKLPISSSDIPRSHLPFSPAIISGQYVFVSGQASVDNNGNIVQDTFEGECRRSFENVHAILKSIGLGLEDIIQVRSYVANQEDLGEYNKVYRQFFSEPFPARTTLIGCLGNLLKFEIEAIACKK